MRELSGGKSRIVHRLHDRKLRRREGRVLVEGPRALRTALSAGAELDFVVIEAGESGRRALESLGPAVLGDDRTFTVPSVPFAELADTETPQGILGVVREPESGLPDRAPERVLVLDRVQDPGNAGTLMRSAAALGCGLVVALDGTVDPWNPKTVRSSVGEAFRVRVASVDWAEFADWRIRHDCPLLVADAGGTDIRCRNGGDPWALLIGNESRGPRPEALQAASEVVALPLAAGVESLNAAMAGSILLWALGPGREPDPAAGANGPNGSGRSEGNGRNRTQRGGEEDG